MWKTGPADALQLMTSQQLANIASARRLQTACREAQPWHSDTRGTASQPVRSKIEQMAATLPRGEADKLNLAARKTGFC
ncbi:putative oxidoreductase Fe-S binding subunit [Kluyvera cryocrescens]|uniref:Putative oxidoreductase Fe-S binding subunit n=1 Tax=Kluyvera cryocrescens TaxID=580 RepID=A0A485AUL6_KLUCR|nr:putative oxidoreductase Fe-S binding subunit [Kluyvera cryocrescens]